MKTLLRYIFILSIICPVVVAGQTHHYKLNVTDFNELVVVDGINVDYNCDPSRAGLVEFDAEKDYAASVIFDHGKGKLKVQLAQRDTPLTGLPTIRVYSSYLTKASNEGDSLLHVISIAPQGAFIARLIGNGRLMVDDIESTTLDAAIISGNGTLTLSGKAANARLSITGTGHIVAPDLVTSEAACSITGTGSIIVNASAKLTAAGIGSGTVHYIGEPVIKKKFLSRVKVVPYKP